MTTINNPRITVVSKDIDVVSQTGEVTIKAIESIESIGEFHWRASFNIGNYHSIELYGLNYYIEQFLTYVSNNDLDSLLYGVKMRYSRSSKILIVHGKMNPDKTISDYSDALSDVIKNIQAPIIPRLKDICQNNHRYIDFGYCHGHYLEHDILVTRTHFILTTDLHSWNKTVEDIVERFINDAECKVYQIARIFHVYTEQGILTAFEFKIPEDMLDTDTKSLGHKIKQMALAFSHL